MEWLARIESLLLLLHPSPQQERGNLEKIEEMSWSGHPV